VAESVHQSFERTGHLHFQSKTERDRCCTEHALTAPHENEQWVASDSTHCETSEEVKTNQWVCALTL